MATAIQEGTAIGISDGSNATVHCTSAFIITHRRRGNRSNQFCNVKGTNVVPGVPHEQDSHRAELGGLMGLLVTLEMSCQVHQIQQGSIELGLDGEGAHKAVFESTHTPVDAKSHDLIRAI